jgi:hypothetical protein
MDGILEEGGRRIGHHTCDWIPSVYVLVCVVISVSLFYLEGLKYICPYIIDKTMFFQA